MLEGSQEHFLDRVFGVLPVMRDRLRDSEKPAVVSLYELLKGGKIPFLASVDKVQVVACHLPHCELCRVWRHIRAQRFEGQPGLRRQLIGPRTETSPCFTIEKSGSLHYDFAGHFRVDRAVVEIRS